LIEDALRRSSSVAPPDMEVVHHRQRLEFAITQSVPPLMVQRELTIAPLDAGTAALK
jgi:hypothetical protein